MPHSRVRGTAVGVKKKSQAKKNTLFVLSPKFVFLDCMRSYIAMKTWMRRIIFEWALEAGARVRLLRAVVVALCGATGWVAVVSSCGQSLAT